MNEKTSQQTGLISEDRILQAKITSPLVIIASLLMLVSYYYGFAYSKSPLLVISTSIVLIIFALTNYIPQLKFSKNHLPYLIIYHLALAFVMIFIMPTVGYFLVLWVLLGYLSYYYYQLKGLIVSLLFLAITLALGMFIQGNVNLQNIVIYMQWLVLIGGVSLILSRIILGTKEVRNDLAQKTTRAEYGHQRLLALINSMTEAVLSVDHKGEINTYNSAALELLDTNSDITGRNISDILKLSDPDHADIDILDVANTVKYILKKSDLYLELGSKNRIALEISISRSSQNTHGSDKNGYIFIIRDITRQKKIDEEKDDFISVVSHELRTPLAVAEANTAMAQLAAKKPTLKPQQILESLDKAHRQIMFLSEMVNDLSTLSKADRKDEEMAIETFSIADVLSELELAYKPLAEKKKLGYTTKVEDGLPNITTSRLYIKEILQNLISNAIKYTETGSINIAVKKNTDKKISIAVKDTGLGISLADQENVFDKFWRSEDVLTRSTGGTGLGLYIASRLAKRINSQIELTSKTGSGSTFQLILAPVASQEVDTSTVVTNEVDNLLS
ncbi:MAG: ATP-binding protein [Patescibacteria group bacterium]|nr:ATP-binding protein [Patescibacteria group bacterium]